MQSRKSFRDQVKADIEAYKRLMTKRQDKKSKPSASDSSLFGKMQSMFGRIKKFTEKTKDQAKKYSGNDKTKNRLHIITELERCWNEMVNNDAGLYDSYQELYATIDYGMSKKSALAVIMQKTISDIDNGKITLNHNNGTPYEFFCTSFKSAVLVGFNINRPDSSLVYSTAKAAIALSTSAVKHKVESTLGTDIHTAGHEEKLTELDVKIPQDKLDYMASRSLTSLRPKYKDYLNNIPMQSIPAYAIRASNIALSSLRGATIDPNTLTETIENSIEAAIKILNPEYEFDKDKHAEEKAEKTASPQKDAEKSTNENTSSKNDEALAETTKSNSAGPKKRARSESSSEDPIDFAQTQPSSFKRKAF